MNALDRERPAPGAEARALRTWLLSRVARSAHECRLGTCNLKAEFERSVPDTYVPIEAVADALASLGFEHVRGTQRSAYFRGRWLDLPPHVSIAAGRALVAAVEATPQVSSQELRPVVRAIDRGYLTGKLGGRLWPVYAANARVADVRIDRGTVTATCPPGLAFSFDGLAMVYRHRLRARLAFAVLTTVRFIHVPLIEREPLAADLVRYCSLLEGIS